MIFGDLTGGEIFHVSADNLPAGGQDAIRRLRLDFDGRLAPLIELIRAKNVSQGRTPVARANMRLGEGPNGRLFLLNKGDGTIRELLP